MEIQPHSNVQWGIYNLKTDIFRKTNRSLRCSCLTANQTCCQQALTEMKSQAIDSRIQRLSVNEHQVRFPSFKKNLQFHWLSTLFFSCHSDISMIFNLTYFFQVKCLQLQKCFIFKICRKLQRGIVAPTSYLLVSSTELVIMIYSTQQSLCCVTLSEILSSPWWNCKSIH